MTQLNKIIYYIILTFALFFTSDIYSQGKIIGIVKDAKYRTPLKDVVISLFDESQNSLHSITKSDGTGFFAFNELEYGRYKIEAQDKDYSVYRIKNIIVSKDSPGFTFDSIYLSTDKKIVTEIILKGDIVSSEDKENSNSLKIGKIFGSVKDSNDYTPIEGASVVLIRNDSEESKQGMYTNGTGLFSFENLEPGKYKIEIAYIGYRNYKANNIIVDEKNPGINLGTIFLSTGLFRTKEVVVQDEKPEMEFNDDKKVFNVEKMLTSRGGTAIDALKKIPMIEVDAQDNISLRGSKNVAILIDNKPMKFSSLRQLPADAIKNVEIITNPSAKYESEGVTGIINIVMKQNDNKGLGYNGYIYSGFRNNESYNGGIGTDFKKSKWSFFLNGGLGDYKYKSDNTSEVTYSQPPSFYDSRSNGDGSSKYYFAGLGTEYEMKKGHSIGADAYANTSKFNNTSNTISNNYNDLHLLTSMLSNKYSGDGYWNSYSTSLYYNGKFDKIGKELNIDFSFNKADNKNTSGQLIQYYDSLSFPVNNTPTNQQNVTYGKNTNLRIQLDYTNPFNDKTKFETGYKGIFRVNDNDFQSDTLNYILNNYVRNDDLTNHFKLSENINAVYGTFSHKIKNFRFKLGLRLEHIYTKGELITGGDNFTKNYLDVFPTVSFSQKFGLAHELQVSYSRRITRPSIYRLNPFIRKYDLKFINYGNPELSPEYSDSYELSYMFISNIVNLTPMAFYRRSTGVISNYSYVTDSNITATTYRNSSSGYSYGMDFIISSRALKWWNINSTFSLYNTKYDAGLTNDYSGEEGFSWKANIRSYFTFGELFNIEVYYDYTGKKVVASGFNKPSQSLDISINKNFFNKKLTVGVRGEDLFKTRKWGSETNGAGVKSVYDYGWDSRGVYLNLSYNFGNTKDYYKKSKNTKKNENEKNDTNEEGNK